jgi:SlyX protein
VFFCVFRGQHVFLYVAEPAQENPDKSGKQMNDNELSSRLESLETRLMHQEASIEELTRTLLRQEHLISAQVAAIDRLQAMIRSLSVTQDAPSGEESPPPHY